MPVIGVVMKVCRVCSEEKELESMKKAKREKDGRANICKACHVQQTLEHRRTKHLKSSSDKKCRRCGLTKSIDRFSPYSHNKNVIRNICRDCYNQERRDAVSKLNIENYYKDAEKNTYSLKSCKEHGKLSYENIGLEIHMEHSPVVVIMRCLLCDKENKQRKYNADNFISNTINSIITCNRCNIDKNIFDFYASELKRTTPTCRECLIFRSKKYYKKSMLKSKYNISLDEYEKMLRDQNFLCKICKQSETHRYKRTGEVTDLSVDHDHATNEVRGLLCRNCNLVIGNSQDRPDILREAALYLEAYEKTT